MDFHFDNRFKAAVTVISNEFIDHCMAEANGEYVKEYLYLCRHEGEAVTVGSIADALNHTEADVKRALHYWQKTGVLAPPEDAEPSGVSGESRVSGEERENPAKRETCAAIDGNRAAIGGDRTAVRTDRSHCTAGEINRLSKDAEFTQLLYIAQKYMNKTFTPVECEVFAYLYGTLHMSAELLEYLVEYCAQNDHTSIRYVEKVALDWHEKKILTVEEAESYSRGFTKDSFAVMKAFGLTGRGPGEKEFEDIRRWFKEYGFTRELVVEACNRTMEAIHTPSFQYADQILKEWKKAGVRTMRDVEALDKNRQAEKAAKTQPSKGQAGRKSGAGKAANRFHNLEEHGYDYDKMVWNMINPGQDEKSRGER